MAACPSCGVENLADAERCRLCGKDLGPRPLDKQTTKCQYCGSLNPSDELTCSVCRRLLSEAVLRPKDRVDRDVVYYPKPETSAKPRTKAPIIGGILLLVVGLGSLGWLVLLTLLSAVAYPEYMEGFSGVLFALWLLVIFMILGAVAAFTRRWWPLASTGGVSALIMTFIFASAFCLIFTGIAFAALLLIALSRREFS